MIVDLHNCRNIDEGSIEIVEKSLNIKYAFNGTGKSTIASAITCAAEGNTNQLQTLRPFKYYYSNEPQKESKVDGIQSMNVSTFNEDYVNKYVFLKDELVKNSFDIFIKTKKYDEHMHEIDELVKEIRVLLSSNPELEGFYGDLNQLIIGFGKPIQNGISKSGIIKKAFANGNKIYNIPEGLEAYENYIISPKNIKWIKWQISGNDFLGISDRCPYCTSYVNDKKDIILKVNQEYDSKEIENLTSLLDLFNRLKRYFSDETKEKIEEIEIDAAGISKDQEYFLLKIRDDAQFIKDRLDKIKNVGFEAFKDVDKVVTELQSYTIKIDFISNFNSEYTKGKIDLINQSINDVLVKAGRLQGEVNKQKTTIQKTIEMYHSEINAFLECAGYQYNVYLDADGGGLYKMKLRHKESDLIVDNAKDFLSYGERNAFALVLFMYDVIRENPDLVILDDPITSFDGNKKFAIMDMLFFREMSLKNKTVLMLTHEFNAVIDAIYVLPRNFSRKPHGTFLENFNGILSEKKIEKKDIKSFHEIAVSNIARLDHNINKLIYLRRLIEIEAPDSPAWDLLSSLFHRRTIPSKIVYDASTNTTQEVAMNVKEITDATKEIQRHIEQFDYTLEITKILDDSVMIPLYYSCTNRYEKLQIYRIIKNENCANDIIKKFVNETFHVENDYLYQLNPFDYELVPDHIIAVCDNEIDALANMK